MTVGTETDTSISGPAMINAVVGIKPTPGLTSRNGVIPSSKTLDSVGPFARTVLDAALALNGMVGSDERDLSSIGFSRRQEEDYAKCVSTKTSLNGAWFGLPIKRCWEFVPNDQKDVAIKIFDAITQAGGKIVNVSYPCAEDRIAADGRWDWYVKFHRETSMKLKEAGSLAIRQRVSLPS